MIVAATSISPNNTKHWCDKVPPRIEPRLLRVNRIKEQKDRLMNCMASYCTFEHYHKQIH